MAKSFPPITNIPNYQAFVANETIQTLTDKEKWTVVTNQKKPIDMYSLILSGRLEGARWQDECSLVTFSKLYQMFPYATNYTYFLDAITDNIVVLDIEPTCPTEIKNKMLQMDNILYAETSMSGKGIHLVFALPKNILKKYPDSQTKNVFKDKENNYYEILLTHYISFTGNLIELPEIDKNDTNRMSFETLFETLASEQKISKHLSEDAVDHISKPDTIHTEFLLEKLKECGKYYEKRTDVNKSDGSAYEFGFGCHLYRQVYQLLQISYIKDLHAYKKEELAWFIYTVMETSIPFRPKHEEVRNGLPWLLYLTNEVLLTIDPSKIQQSDDVESEGDSVC